jgi:small subunit ribosomal protein S6
VVHYETVFVLPGDLQPQKVDEYVDKVKSLIEKNGGEITLSDKWGRRRLAYPIERQREGFYTFLQFKAPPTAVAELTQFFRVSEEVIRQVVTKALKGKPASPMMSVPPAGFHAADGARPAPAASTPVPTAAPAAPTAAVPADSATPEASHASAPAPAPAQ